tara:strand:+ start:13648 stop:19233 length:5586 start_codon:yes stop_codon:yes gene_type:complete
MSGKANLNNIEKDWPYMNADWIGTEWISNPLCSKYTKLTNNDAGKLDNNYQGSKTEFINSLKKFVEKLVKYIKIQPTHGTSNPVNATDKEKWRLVNARLRQNRCSDLVTVATLYHPHVIYDVYEDDDDPDKQYPFKTWDDAIDRKYTNIQYGYTIDLKQYYDIRKIGDSICATLDHFHNYFFPNWMDIFPTGNQNRPQESELVFGELNNNAIKDIFGQTTKIENDEKKRREDNIKQQNETIEETKKRQLLEDNQNKLKDKKEIIEKEKIRLKKLKNIKFQDEEKNKKDEEKIERKKKFDKLQQLWDKIIGTVQPETDEKGKFDDVKLFPTWKTSIERTEWQDSNGQIQPTVPKYNDLLTEIKENKSTSKFDNKSPAEIEQKRIEKTRQELKNKQIEKETSNKDEKIDKNIENEYYCIERKEKDNTIFLTCKTFFEYYHPRRWIEGEVRYEPWFAKYSMTWPAQLKLFHYYKNVRFFLLTAGTGVGKSVIMTILLWYLTTLDVDTNTNNLSRNNIICTQPRIKPTQDNAETISQELFLPKINPYKKKSDDDFDENDLTKKQLVRRKERRKDTYWLKYNTNKYNHDIKDLKEDNEAESNNLNERYGKFSKFTMMTDGTLLQKLMGDDDNDDNDDNDDKDDKITTYVIDEAHEHQINMDLSTMFLRAQLSNISEKTFVAITATVNETTNGDGIRYRNYFSILGQGNKTFFDMRLDIQQPYSIKNLHPIDESSSVESESVKLVLKEINFQKNKKENRKTMFLIEVKTAKQTEKISYDIQKKGGKNIIAIPINNKSWKNIDTKKLCSIEDPQEIQRQQFDFNFKYGYSAKKGTYKCIVFVITTDLLDELKEDANYYFSDDNKVKQIIDENQEFISKDDGEKIIKNAQIKAIQRAIKYPGKNILVFVSTTAQTKKLAKAIQKKTPKSVIAVPLSSESYEKDEVKKITKSNTKAENIQRRRDDFNFYENADVPIGTYKTIVYVATNIAEASVTMNVDTVIDTGIVQLPQYEPTFMLTYKDGYTFIDKNSRMQRKGRVGRTKPGKVFYEYSTDDVDNSPLRYGMCNADLSSILFDLVYKLDKNYQKIIPTLLFDDKEDEEKINPLLDNEGLIYFIHPYESKIKRKKYFNETSILGSADIQDNPLNNLAELFQKLKLTDTVMGKLKPLSQTLNSFLKNKTIENIEDLTLYDILCLIYAQLYGDLNEMAIVISVLRSSLINKLNDINEPWNWGTIVQFVKEMQIIFPVITNDYSFKDNTMDTIKWYESTSDLKFKQVLLNIDILKNVFSNLTKINSNLTIGNILHIINPHKCVEYDQNKYNIPYLQNIKIKPDTFQVAQGSNQFMFLQASKIRDDESYDYIINQFIPIKFYYDVGDLNDNDNNNNIISIINQYKVIFDSGVYGSVNYLNDINAFEKDIQTIMQNDEIVGNTSSLLVNGYNNWYNLPSIQEEKKLTQPEYIVLYSLLFQQLQRIPRNRLWNEENTERDSSPTKYLDLFNKYHSKEYKDIFDKSYNINFVKNNKFMVEFLIKKASFDIISNIFRSDISFLNDIDAFFTESILKTLFKNNRKKDWKERLRNIWSKNKDKVQNINLSNLITEENIKDFDLYINLLEFNNLGIVPYDGKLEGNIITNVGKLLDMFYKDITNPDPDPNLKTFSSKIITYANTELSNIFDKIPNANMKLQTLRNYVGTQSGGNIDDDITGISKQLTNNDLINNNQFQHISFICCRKNSAHKLKLFSQIDEFHRECFNTAWSIALSMDHSSSRLIIAKLDPGAVIAGVCIVDVSNPNKVFLHNLCVNKLYRKYGIGSFLLAYANQKYNYIELDVMADMKDTLFPFYLNKNKFKELEPLKKNNYKIRLYRYKNDIPEKYV